MKTLRAVAAVVAVSVLPGIASAQWVAAGEVFGSLSEFKQGGAGTEDGDGFGLRGRVNLPGTGFSPAPSLLMKVWTTTSTTPRPASAAAIRLA